MNKFFTFAKHLALSLTLISLVPLHGAEKTFAQEAREAFMARQAARGRPVPTTDDTPPAPVAVAAGMPREEEKCPICYQEIRTIDPAGLVVLHQDKAPEHTFCRTCLRASLATRPADERPACSQCLRPLVQNEIDALAPTIEELFKEMCDYGNFKVAEELLTVPSINTPENIAQLTAAHTQQPTVLTQLNLGTTLPRHQNPATVTIDNIINLASQRNQLALLERLLTSPIIATPKRRLSIACRTGNLEEAQKLFADSGTEENFPAELRNTLLHIASTHKHTTIVQLLLINGANPNIADPIGRRLLHQTLMQEGSEEIAGLLITHGADINMPDSLNNTALHLACLYNRKAIVPLLLARTDIHALNLDGESPFVIAYSLGHSEIAQLLAQNGVDINADIPELYLSHGKLLHSACRDGDEKAVRSLVYDYHADINIPNGDGDLPLHLAIRGNHKAIARLLITHGAKLETVDKDKETPLHSALTYGTDESIVQLLAEHNAQLNTLDRYGNTPLHCATWRGQEASVRLLLAHNADPNIRDRRGYTALHHAVYKGYEAIVRLLLQHNVALDMPDPHGKTPLVTAFAMKNKAIARLLVTQGAAPHNLSLFHRAKILSWKLKSFAQRMLTRQPIPVALPTGPAPVAAARAEAREAEGNAPAAAHGGAGAEE